MISFVDTYSDLRNLKKISCSSILRLRFNEIIYKVPIFMLDKVTNACRMMSENGEQNGDGISDAKQGRGLHKGSRSWTLPFASNVRCLLNETCIYRSLQPPSVNIRQRLPHPLNPLPRRCPVFLLHFINYPFSSFPYHRSHLVLSSP